MKRRKWTPKIISLYEKLYLEKNWGHLKARWGLLKVEMHSVYKFQLGCRLRSGFSRTVGQEGGRSSAAEPGALQPFQVPDQHPRDEQQHLRWMFPIGLFIRSINIGDCCISLWSNAVWGRPPALILSVIKYLQVPNWFRPEWFTASELD